MKKEGKTYVIFSVAIFILLFFECYLQPPATQNDHLQNLPDIREVIINLPCNVYITQDDQQKLLIEGDVRGLNHLKTTIENGSLHINNNLLGTFLKYFDLFSDQPGEINIYISLKDIKKLNVCHDCNGMAFGSINQKRLNLSVTEPGTAILINKSGIST